MVKRLNYIGSKFQLLSWIETTIQTKTGWEIFQDKRVADLFAGTGIVSHFFREKGAKIISNDAELYSSIITHALAKSAYTPRVAEIITQLNAELAENKHKTTTGFITQKYSPHAENQRMFFTEENAKRIDYLRQRFEEFNLTEDDYKFLLASLLLSADAVSNVPAVYGCYLKNFKAKATKLLTLVPTHELSAPADSQIFHSDVLSDTMLEAIHADIVYLDPPYNERQYSKNYFPLNMIALTPTEQNAERLKGKTGIPESCFLSSFCKKGKVVEEAFEKLFRTLKTTWIFLSYNSESLVSKEQMLALMGKYGTASVVERDYKRFKSFEYNTDKQIQEYLFCLKKSTNTI
jgi:adenine-specific DNA-methyltransferase